jgi:hypothetical protein
MQGHTTDYSEKRVKHTYVHRIGSIAIFAFVFHPVVYKTLNYDTTV